MKLYPGTSEEVFAIASGEKISIPKAMIVFDEWTGKTFADTYGGKAVLDHEGEPLFAELVILKTLCREGWSGVWVDNYRKKFRVGMPGIEAPVTPPADQQAVLDKIRDKNGSMSGCWDVFAWKDGKVLFAESKRSGKDQVRSSQVKWLASALAVGLVPTDFLLIEWFLAQGTN